MLNCIEKGYLHRDISGWNVCLDSAIGTEVLNRLTNDLENFKGAADFPIYVNISEEQQEGVQISANYTTETLHRALEEQSLSKGRRLVPGRS